VRLTDARIHHLVSATHFLCKAKMQMGFLSDA
jgi:hypothetical protein